MRVDTARPWTWLLAGAAGWGVLAWALALAGMGERLPPLPDDAALAKPLPPLRTAQPSRIGPLGQYSEIGQRPLFATDRRPKPFFLQGEGDPNAAAAFDYVLTSVMITPNLQLAILQPPDGSQSLRVKLGDAPEPQPAWRLVSLNARSAVFEGPEGQKTLELRVFDGAGGQRPTAPGTAGAAPTPAAQAVQAATAAAEANERPGPQGPAVVDPSPGTAPPGSSTARPAATANAPAPAVTPEAQMEAIRKRIQARREQLRREAAQAQPPAK